MGEMNLYRETLEKFLKKQGVVEDKHMSWAYFQGFYNGLADLGFTELYMVEDVDQAEVWQTVARTLTASGQVALALAFLWQAGVNQAVLTHLLEASPVAELYSAKLIQGDAYLNWPWSTETGERLYPLTFGNSEEKFFILEPDGDGQKVFLGSMERGFSVTERFAWAGVQEVRLDRGAEPFLRKNISGA